MTFVQYVARQIRLAVLEELTPTWGKVEVYDSLYAWCYLQATKSQ